jgi:hypothetical protein
LTGETECSRRRRSFFARNRERVHNSDGRGVVDNAAKFFRQSHPLPCPINDQRFQFSRRRRRAPRHRIHIQRRSRDFAEDSRPSLSPAEVTEKHRMAPMHHAGNDQSIDVGKNFFERFRIFGRFGW